MILGFVVLTLVTAFATIFWPRGPRPCKETFERLREGMTKQEVYATVGGPPGDYSGGATLPLKTHWHPDDMWWAKDGVLGVRFDDAGHAYEVQVTDGVRWPQPSVWSRCRSRFGF